MANRYTLHFKHLDEFKAWLDAQGIEHRPGRGFYQHMQVRHRGEWQAIYRRISATQHFSVPDPLAGMVTRFYRERKVA